jgi:beta-lactamase superfamily II metal-dependent hydrolase
MTGPEFCRSFVLLTIAAVSTTSARSATPPTLRIVHFSVGNADATLLVLEGAGGDKKFVKTVLIDAGDSDGADIVRAIKKQNINALDYAIATQRGSSHAVQGVVKAIRMTGDGLVYERDHAWPAGQPPHPGSIIDLTRTPNALRNQVALQQNFDEFVNTFRNRLAIECVAANGSTLDWTQALLPADENFKSLAFKVTFGDFRYFVGGSITGGGPVGWSWRRSVDVESHVARRVGQVDVLRVSHHGSSASSNAVFLAALNPAVAIVSVDKSAANDSLFHWPSREVLDRLTKLPRLDTILVTGEISTVGGLTAEDRKKIRTAQGDITISTTGEGTFQVNGGTFNLPHRE